jgi:GNAT superfamily N-acetyltransferase
MFSLNEVEVVLATENDILGIILFLSEPEIDQSFLLPLSSRKISITERVTRNFPDGFWLLALCQGGVAGCRGCRGLTMKKGRVVEFSTLAVRVDFRGIGLGSLLVQRASEIALKRYAPLVMQFDSWSTNEAVEKIALKAGFVKKRTFDDPSKRPPGVQSAEYVLKL